MLVEELLQISQNWKESTYVGAGQEVYIKTLRNGKLTPTHKVIGCGLDENWKPFLMVEELND